MVSHEDVSFSAKGETITAFLTISSLQSNFDFTTMSNFYGHIVSNNSKLGYMINITILKSHG